MARKIQVEIVGDASSLQRAFRKAGGSSDSFGSKMRGTFASLSKGALALGGAVTTLSVAVGVKSVKAASDLSEQINKTNVVFGKSAGVIQKWATTTAASIGVSNRAALEAAGTFGNMLVPMGIARADAAGMSKRFVQLAADMASFNNASPEETLDALRAGLAGETEPLRRFGVFLNADRIAAEALSTGLAETNKDLTKIKVANLAVSKAQRAYTESVKKHGPKSREAQEDLISLEVAHDRLTKAMAGSAPKLTAQQKAMATYSLILKDTKDAQGDFQRTSDSLPNVLRSIRAVVEDLSAAFGEGLLPVVQKVAGDLRDRLADPEFKERVRELGKEVGERLRKAVEAIGRWFKDNWPEIKEAFRTGARLAGQFAEAVRKVFDWFQKVASVTPGGAGTLIGVILGGLLAAKLAAAALQAKILSARLLLISVRLAPIVAGILAIQKFKEDGLFGGGDPKNWKGYIPGYGWIWGGKNKGEGQKPPLKPPEPPITGRAGGSLIPRASGGPVQAGVAYRVGERGPEMFIPTVSGNIVPNGGGGGGLRDIVINLDGREVSRWSVPHLQRQARRGVAQQRGHQAGHALGLT